MFMISRFQKNGEKNALDISDPNRSSLRDPITLALQAEER